MKFLNVIFISGSHAHGLLINLHDIDTTYGIKQTPAWGRTITYYS